MDAARLLDAWEAGWARGPLDRGLAKLVADLSVDAGSVARLTVGERDRALFALRAALFGTAVEAVSACPRCATDVEVGFDIHDLLGTAGVAPPSVDVAGARFRLPASADVAAVLTDVPLSDASSEL